MDRRVSIAVLIALLLVGVCGVAPAAAQSGRRRAMELFRQSSSAYEEGRFEDAARLLRQAHSQFPDATLTYNLARALEGAGDIEGAVEAYRDYLNEAPEAEDANGVRARIANLERRLEEFASERRRLEERAARAPERPSQERRARWTAGLGSPEEPSPEPRQLEAAPWVIVGFGAAGIVAGAVFGVVGTSRRQEADKEPSGAAAYAAFQDASTLTTAANVSFVVGGVALLVGGIWAIVDIVAVSNSAAPSEEDAAASLQLRVSPQGLALSGTF